MGPEPRLMEVLLPRCCFIHTELPSNGAANGGGSGAAEGGNTPSNQNGNSNGNNNPNGDTRNRSMSTNSDPNDPPSSLLARISAKAQANNIARSGDGSPANNSSGNNNNGAANNGAGQPTEAVVAAAINRAMAKFGAPDPSVTNTVLRKLDAPPPPPPVEVVPAPKVPAVFSNFPVGNSSSNGGSGGLGGGHHRISASVDFGRVSRNLGSDLTAGFGGGGHAVSTMIPCTSINNLTIVTYNSAIHRRLPSSRTLCFLVARTRNSQGTRRLTVLQPLQTTAWPLTASRHRLFSTGPGPKNSSATLTRVHIGFTEWRTEMSTLISSKTSK